MCSSRTPADNIWVPAIEAASLEDDESIQDMWANLLANAADSEGGKRIHQVHVSILKEITFEDARFLNALFRDGRIELFTTEQLLSFAADCGLITVEKNELPKLSRILSMLRRQGLVELVPTPIAEHTEMTNKDGEQDVRLSDVGLVPRWELTPLAVEFLGACRAPKVIRSSMR
jgi:hypothetical protein